MKWVLIAVLALAVLAGAGVWVWEHRGMPGHEVVFQWNHARHAWPDCSATVKRECMTSFTLTDATDGDVISSNIPLDARTYTYRPGWEFPPGFRHVFTLQVNGFGSDGAPIRSQPATVMVENPKWRFGHGSAAAAVR